MQKDYAKHKSTRKSTSRRGQTNSTGRSLGGPFWLIIGILIGMVCVGLVYIKQFDLPYIKQILERHAAVAAKASQVAKAEHKPDAPRFDFYTVLPHMHVVQTAMQQTPPPAPPKKVEAPVAATAVPVTAAKPVDVAQNAPKIETAVAAQPKTADANNTNSSHYIVQIAAFQAQADAERVKAEIAMLGFNAKVIVVKTNSSTWYRVLLGPYSSQKIAQADQQKLSTNGVRGFVRKLAG